MKNIRVDLVAFFTIALLILAKTADAGPANWTSGFGSGGSSGGSGNLSGTLTSPKIPYASAVHTLSDSTLSQDTGTDVMQSGTFTVNSAGGTDLVVSETGVDRSNAVDQTFTFDNSGAGNLNVAVNGTVTVNSAGGTDAVMTEVGISRNNAADQSFAFSNPGAGVLNVTVDGDLQAATLHDTTLTQGSVLFAGAGGLVAQDNANFFWTAANKTLGIGTTSSNANVPLWVELDHNMFTEADLINTTDGIDAETLWFIRGQNQYLELISGSDSYSRVFPGGHPGAVRILAGDVDGLNIISNRGLGGVGANTGMIRFITSNQDLSALLTGNDANTRMVIDNAGHVGIGTIAPAIPFEVDTASNGVKTFVFGGYNNGVGVDTQAEALVNANNASMTMQAWYHMSNGAFLTGIGNSVADYGAVEVQTSTGNVADAAGELHLINSSNTASLYAWGFNNGGAQVPVMTLTNTPGTGFAALAVTGTTALEEMTAPSVSAAGESKLYADSTSHTLKLSENTGAFFDVLTTNTGVTKSSQMWCAEIYLGLTGAGIPAANTVVGQFKTDAASTGTDVLFATNADGVAGTGTATLDLTDTGGTVKCTINFDCTIATTQTGNGSCSSVALAANTIYQARSKTQCAGAGSIMYPYVCWKVTTP